MILPSYGAYPVRTPAGRVVGYVHHDTAPAARRYRAVPRVHPGLWGSRRPTRYATHQAAAVACLAHHYTTTSGQEAHA